MDAFALHYGVMDAGGEYPVCWGGLLLRMLQPFDWACIVRNNLCQLASAACWTLGGAAGRLYGVGVCAGRFLLGASGLGLALFLRIDQCAGCWPWTS